MSLSYRSQNHSSNYSSSPDTPFTSNSSRSTQSFSQPRTQFSDSTQASRALSTTPVLQARTLHNPQLSKSKSQLVYTRTLSSKIDPADFDDSDEEGSILDQVPPSLQLNIKPPTTTQLQQEAASHTQEQGIAEGDYEDDYLFESDDEEPIHNFENLQVSEGRDDYQVEDDGDELARLLQQAQQSRNRSLASSTNQGAMYADDEGAKSERNIGISTETRADRRAQALEYLESIPLTFLAQIHTSLKVLNHREKEGSSKSKTKKKTASRKRKQKEGDSTDDEDSGSSQGKKQEEAMEGEVGVEMRLKNRSNGMDQIVSFPDDPVTFETSGKEPAMHRMACVMRVASLLYEAILTNSVTTKRDIYYKDVALFKTQAVVDKLVDDIAATAGLKRQDFHVCATSKGLIASSTLRVYLRSGEELTFSATNPSLIPPIERIERVEAAGEVDWVLIVEKDAVFQTLCAARLVEHERLGPGILVTGKGYPDLATIQLLHLIAETFPSQVYLSSKRSNADKPSVPFYALVDADPHGLDILSVYTRGSKATKFSKDHEDLALGDRLEWLGVKGSELMRRATRHGIKHDELLHLSEKDVQKAMAMLRDRRDLPKSWKRELCHMLHTNRKAEIQILSRGSLRDNDQANEALDEVFRSDGGSFATGSGNGCVGEGGLVGYIVEGMMRSQ